MTGFKKHLLKKCMEPGIKGKDTIDKLERGWTLVAMIAWIPIIGWIMKPIVGIFYPNAKEIENALRTGKIE